MTRSTDFQLRSGFNKVLVAIVATAIIAGTTVLAYQHQTQAAVGQQTYTSAPGGFSFTYPTGWTVTEGAAGVDDEILIAPVSSMTSTSDQFLMTLIIAKNPDVSDPPAAIPDGTVKQLANGLDVWASTSTSASRSGASVGRTVCPELQVTNAAQTHLSYALKNGQYLALTAGFCQGQGSTTSLTFGQQLATQDWQTAVSILNSITFN